MRWNCYGINSCLRSIYKGYIVILSMKIVRVTAISTSYVQNCALRPD